MTAAAETAVVMAAVVVVAVVTVEAATAAAEEAEWGVEMAGLRRCIPKCNTSSSHCSPYCTMDGSLLFLG